MFAPYWSDYTSLWLHMLLLSNWLLFACLSHLICLSGKMITFVELEWRCTRNTSPNHLLAWHFQRQLSTFWSLSTKMYQLQCTHFSRFFFVQITKHSLGIIVLSVYLVSEDTWSRWMDRDCITLRDLLSRLACYMWWPRGGEFLVLRSVEGFNQY